MCKYTVHTQSCTIMCSWHACGYIRYDTEVYSAHMDTDKAAYLLFISSDN